jgi:hypothetical protein
MLWHESSEFHRVKTLRIAKRILLWTICSVVVILSLLYVLARVYNEELKELALTEINKGLKTKMSIGEADLTLIQRFPRASLRCRDVYIRGTMSEQDTLMTAETVHLEFRLFDILRGHYTVRTVNISGAKVMIKRNAEGQENYRFWKESGDSDGDFRFSVDELILEKSSLEWADLQAQLWALFEVDKARLSGGMKAGTLETDLRLDGRIRTFKMPWAPKLEDKPLSASGRLVVKSDEDLLTLDPLNLKIDKLPLIIKGNITTGADAVLNLRAESRGADLASLLAIMPTELDEALADYAISGRADITATLEGSITRGRSPEIVIELPVSKGKFKHKPSGAVLSDLRSDLTCTIDSRQTNFDIRNLEGAFRGSPFSVSGTLTNPAQPVFDLRCKGEFPLGEMASFFRLDSVALAEGHVVLDARLKGRFSDIKKVTAAEWSALDISGSLKFEKVGLVPKGSEHKLERLSGQCAIEGNTISTQSLELRLNQNDFRLSGMLRGLLPYLLTEEGKLGIEAECTTKHLDLNQFLSGSAAGESAEVSMPERVHMRLNLLWGKVSYRQFAAEDIRGTLRYEDGQLVCNPISLKTCGGELTANLRLTDRAKHFDLSASGDLRQVDLRKLFVAFENFGQTFLTSDNLKGRLTSGFVLALQTDKQLAVKPMTISCVAQMKVENGELIQLTSLRNISDYLKKKKLLSAIVDADGLEKKLKHITFETLENTIRVKDGTITIPFMEIKSSALDITVEGWQTFDDRIDYTVGFYLRDVLLKKKRHQDVEDDGLGKTFFIRMTGTTDNPVFSIDKDAAREKRRKDIEAEKQLIKDIFKEEFSKKNTEPKPPGPNDEKPASIEVTWPEDPKPTDPKPEEPKKKKRTLKDLLGGGEEDDF